MIIEQAHFYVTYSPLRGELEVTNASFAKAYNFEDRYKLVSLKELHYAYLTKDDNAELMAEWTNTESTTDDENYVEFTGIIPDDEVGFKFYDKQTFSVRTMNEIKSSLLTPILFPDFTWLQYCHHIVKSRHYDLNN